MEDTCKLKERKIKSRMYQEVIQYNPLQSLQSGQLPVHCPPASSVPRPRCPLPLRGEQTSLGQHGVVCSWDHSEAGSSDVILSSSIPNHTKTKYQVPLSQLLLGGNPFWIRPAPWPEGHGHSGGSVRLDPSRSAAQSCNSTKVWMTWRLWRLVSIPLKSPKKSVVAAKPSHESLT